MRSLAEQELLWDIGVGEWGFKYSTWLDTLDELYFDSIMHTVQLDSIVTEVDTSGAYPVVTWDGRHGQASGSVSANAVLVTLPLGVLKAGSVTFTPPLSASKQAAIANLGMGNGGKMFLQFSSRVWPVGTTLFFTEGEAGYCWSLHYKGGDGDATLVCYTVGENAEVLDALQNDNERIDHVLADLDTMYPGTIFSDAFDTGYWKRTDQMQNNLGTYSFPTIGSYPTDGSPSMREVLATPEGTVLYFAGEATSNAYSATVFGALNSGLRAAGEVDMDHEPLPEPAGWLQLGAGLGFLVLLRRVSRRA
jgi:monoamine oxidase